MQTNMLPRKKKINMLRPILVMVAIGLLVYWIFATYKPGSVVTNTIEGTGYTLGHYLDLLEEEKEKQKPHVKSLIEGLLEIKLVESHLRQNGIDDANTNYLYYETGGTTYKIGLEIVK